MAYLQTPVQFKGGRRGESRLARRRAQGLEDPQMPPVEHGKYLLKYLHKVGPSMGTGMGAIPLTFGELQAWQQQTGLDLQPWEVETLRRLSSDYVLETHRAASFAAMPPWVSDIEVQRKAVDDGLRALFRSLMVKQADRTKQ